MKKTVLLTGAGGFIGSHTLAHLLEKSEYDIVCLDSFRHQGKTDRITQVLGDRDDWKQRTRVITHDLIAPISPQMIASIGPVEYILNVASESHVDRSIEHPVPFIRNNVDLMINMLEYARAVKPTVFIQISTDEVYGAAPEGVNHVEWSPILPSNPYSASKAAQEAIAISYWRTYNVPLVITNTMNNFGEMQDPEKFIPRVMQQINNGKKVTIHGSKDYIGSRYYLHARNHADALLFLLWKGYPTMYKDSSNLIVPDRYNVVGEAEVNNLDLAKMIAEHIGKKLDYELVDFHATRPGHDRRYALDGKKLQDEGWIPPVPFKESLERTIDWTLGRPLWLI